MKIVILAGGRGIRAFPFTSYLPKPMLPLGSSPIIVQVIKSFVRQGYDDFVIAAGYRKSILEDYFEGKDIGANIEIVDTGDETDTGGRVYACRDLVDDRFIVTYADGLSDVPLNKLIDFHESHDGLATITSVPMRSQYGVLTIEDNGRIDKMEEKPIIMGHWMNVGYIVFDKEVFSHWQGQNLEREVLAHLVEKEMAFSYRHEGFFKSMDSYKDAMEFEDLLGHGSPLPWDVKEG